MKKVLGLLLLAGLSVSLVGTPHGAERVDQAGSNASESSEKVRAQEQPKKDKPRYVASNGRIVSELLVMSGVYLVLRLWLMSEEYAYMAAAANLENFIHDTIRFNPDII